MKNRTFVVMIALTLAPLLLVGCEKATESVQKTVQDTKEIASDITEKTIEETIEKVTEDVKEEATNVAETTSETISDTANEMKEQADASVENATVAEAKETLAISPTPNDAALALAKKSGCLACHKIDNKLVGPAWKDIAARYKGDAEAKNRLIEKVSKGGKGNWTEVTGGAPMPPYSPRVSDEDIEKLVAFVLSL